MISGYFISCICKAFFYICDLDISLVPTNFGLGFCIEFYGYKFWQHNILLDFASNFNGVNFGGHVLHPNFGEIYFASDFVT